MKLATALSERSDLLTRINQLHGRLISNARYQEGDSPSEDVDALLNELNFLTDRYEYLVSRINLTNASVYHEGLSLTEMLAKREAMKLKISILRNFLSEASNKVSRSTRTEILVKSSVDVMSEQKNLDVLSKDLRILDETIQFLNWTNELK